MNDISTVVGEDIFYVFTWKDVGSMTISPILL